MTLEGVDLSHYNQVTNAWADFVIARACYGNARDAMYATHRANTRAAGKPFGAYLFLLPPSAAYGSIAAQVAAFLNIASDADGLAIDWEGSPAPTHAQAVEAVGLVRASLRPCGFYASESVFFDAGQDWNWIAHYGAPDAYWPPGADLYQWQGMPLDRDRFRGSASDLLALWAGATMGLDLTLPPVGVAGTLGIPQGTDSIRLSNSAHYRVPTNVSRPAYTASIAGGGSSGYIVDLDGDIAHFIRGSQVGLVFTPTPLTVTGLSQADVEAAVLLEHEANRKAALAAVGESIP